MTEGPIQSDNHKKVPWWMVIAGAMVIASIKPVMTWLRTSPPTTGKLSVFVEYYVDPDPNQKKGNHPK